MGHGVLSASLAFRSLFPVFLFRQLACIPAAAEGADEADARNKLPSLEIDGGALVLEERGFRSQHFKVAGDAALVALVRYLIGMLSRIDGPLLHSRLIPENPQAGELVFNVVEGA